MSSGVLGHGAGCGLFASCISSVSFSHYQDLNHSFGTKLWLICRVAAQSNFTPCFSSHLLKQFTSTSYLAGDLHINRTPHPSTDAQRSTAQRAAHITFPQ